MVRAFPRWVREYLRGCVAIDTRTLAVFRIAVATLIVADLFSRARNFSFYYTDDGVVPQSVAESYTASEAVSVYFFTSDPTLIAGLFVLQGVIALQLLVGYKTRLATVLSFLLVVSLDHHNPLVLSYADTLFRLLLFWSIFLPLGERWSIDAVHATRAPRPQIASVASALILSQMVYMYVVNGHHKTKNQLWTSGEAAPLVFGIDEMTFLLGDAMREFLWLIELGGLLWFYILVGAWLLIFFQGRVRYLFATLFFGGHLAFALTVRIGAFAFVGMAGVFLFYQRQFWRDGRWVSSAVGVNVSNIWRELSRLERVADRVPRLQFGGERMRTLRAHSYTVVMVILVLSMGLVGGTNGLQYAGMVDEEEQYDDQIRTVATALSIDQPSWSVFAPNPRTTDRYYVFPARTADGQLVDAFNEREFTYDRPHDELQRQHDTYRQRFYMNSIRRASDDAVIVQEFTRHLCERWQEEHDTELTHLNMRYVNEDITRESVDDPTVRDRSVFRISLQTCDDGAEPTVLAWPPS